MTTLTNTPPQRELKTLAADIARELEACDEAQAEALEHALAAGRLLTEAKAQLAHGAWLPWLEANTTVSERTAQQYMQLASDENARRVAGLPADTPVREAYRAIAEPREPKVDLAAGLRAAGLGAVDVREEVESRPARQPSWPRPGMERRTWQDVGKLLAAAERSRESATGNGLNDWSRAQSLLAAAGQLRDASELLTELAGTLGT